MHGNLFLEIIFNKLLGLFHRLVLVITLAFKHNEGGLTLAVDLDLKILCSLDSQFAVGIFFQEVEKQVPE